MKEISVNELRRTLSVLSALEADVDTVIRDEQGLRDGVSTFINELSEEESASVLAEMDVESINYDKIGLRIGVLRKNGIENMRQLCALSREELEALPGIGEDSSLVMYKRAKAIAQEVRSGVKLRLDPEKKSQAAAGLICCLQDAMDNRRLIEAAKELKSIYQENIAAASAAAMPLTRPLRRLFLPSAKKRLALDAAGYLKELAGGEYRELASEIIDSYANRRVLSKDDCWEDFSRRAADYYAKLGELDSSAVDRMADTSRALPAELVETVETTPLKLDGLNAALRSYQQFGVKYIVKQGRVLLGDEMGLGKTVQAIAAMVALRNEGESRFMVICPASVLINWAREIVKFSDLPVTVIKGGNVLALRKFIADGGVAVTTYESISRFSLPAELHLGMLIADEAHYVKNRAAIRTRALLGYAAHTERILFMTGTALENKVDEMCALIDCLRPDIAPELKDLAYLSSAPQFREKLAPVYLRRTREEVLTELPELVEKEEWCELSAAELLVYKASVLSENFMSMRQVSWFGIDPQRSSKGARLLEIADMAAEEGRKTIVFSFFRDTINSAAALLKGRCIGPITGSVSSLRRQQMVDEFNAAPEGTVLLCQVQAGGTGLNIQCASVIVFCEPQIKPSIENQAISRAYRMGQVRNVLVYRLLCDNTVDERIMELLRDKQEQFDFFAEESSAGSEAIRSENEMAKSIIALEKEHMLEADGE